MHGSISHMCRIEEEHSEFSDSEEELSDERTSSEHDDCDHGYSQDDADGEQGQDAAVASRLHLLASRVRLTASSASNCEQCIYLRAVHLPESCAST